jgi:translocation and assembly module TamA
MAARMPRRATVVAAAAAAALASGCLRARGTAEEPIVTKVTIEGAHALDPDAIKKGLATQEPTGWVLKDGYPLDPDALAVDRKRVEAFYRERGYYDARVEDVRVIPDGHGRARVVLRVHEGPPIRVTKVEVTGLEVAPEARAALGKLPLRPGDVFTEGGYDAARAAILSALRRTGYANAEVRQSARVVPEDGTAEVTYAVTPGARYRFGSIFVAGAAAVPRTKVRDQASVEIRPGDWFDESKLPKAQARVFDLGVFGGVRVSRGQPDPDRGTIPVVVQVREAPFRTLRFGPGVGAQVAQRYDVHAIFGWSHRNLFGDLRRLSFDLRAGYAWLPRPKKEGWVGLATTEFQQPGALGRRIDTSARLEVERGIEDAYDFWSERVRLGLPLRLAPRWTLVPSYGLEIYQVHITGTVAAPGTPQNPTGFQLENCPRGVCLLSYLEQRIAWDGRDDALDPHRGLYLGVSLQEGFDVFGYGYRYLRFLPEARAFLPLAPNVVVAVRGRFGALVPLGESAAPPLVARFYAGGPSSMRGYYTRRLSPMALQDDRWVPVGGNGLLDGSIELRFPIAGNLGGAIFVDAGNVAPPSSLPTEYQVALDPTLVQYSTGIGLRWRTAFGPLAVFGAVRVPTDLRPNVGFDHRFPTVPATDHREPIAAFHITLGEAF